MTEQLVVKHGEIVQIFNQITCRFYIDLSLVFELG